jgi:hypothetical protein
MLASINLNYGVYVEPNERTIDRYAEYYAPDHKEEYIQKLKERVIYVPVRGNLIPLLKMQFFEFIGIFGDEMEAFSANTAFEHNQAFFELDNFCPIYKNVPELPEPTVYVLTPHSHFIIPTGWPDTTTVRVNFDDMGGEVFSYWGTPDDPEDKYYLDEHIVDGTYDHILRKGRDAIHLFNNTDKQQTCRISYARFVK